MSDIPEFIITEGRAYHRGDVVLLRMKRGASNAFMQQELEALTRITDRTGVEFVLLDELVEVVEREVG